MTGWKLKYSHKSSYNALAEWTICLDYSDSEQEWISSWANNSGAMGEGKYGNKLIEY